MDIIKKLAVIPFLPIKKINPNSLRPIPSELKRKISEILDLSKEEFICTNCYQKVNSLVKSLSASGPSELETWEGSSSSSNSLFHCEELHDFHEFWEDIEEANSSLSALAVSPLKTGE